MERDELIERLKGYEWNDVEFKRAQSGVPESAYETVSAFANTEGGWIIFGVQDKGGHFEIVGILQVDKVQNDFLSVLRSGQKLNRIIAVREQLIQEEGKPILVFYIPETSRREKPVYLNGDIRRSFIRRGGCDERCTQSEIERLVRDAADERYDCGTIEMDPEHCFDEGSIRWYRRLLHDRNPGQDETLSDLEFLHHWGLVLEVKNRLLPTRAALLMFSSEPILRQILPRPVFDVQWIRRNWSEELPAERWADRLVVETNLISAWRALLDRYLHHAEQSFAVDPETLQRSDGPPDYITFREATINLLIHQDYADHARKPVIQFYNDRTMFWNPGDAFAPSDQLLEPGEKEVRNPRIVAAFRRIGLSEQAGTGVRSIFSNWQQLGHVPPDIRNDKAAKSFELALLKERLLSEEQLLFQASLGAHLSETEARVFALVCRKGRAGPREIRALTGLTSREVQAAFDGLAVQALISRQRIRKRRSLPWRTI
jgi:ATP-dependent DNA helicase RecG